MSDKVSITAEDVGLTKNASGRLMPNGLNGGRGISLLGWFVRNGGLLTDVVDNVFDDASIRLSYGDVYLSEKTKTIAGSPEVKVKEVVEKKIESENPTKVDSAFGLDDFGNMSDEELFGAPFKTAMGEAVRNKDIKKAKQWIKDTLGMTDEQVVVIDEVIGVAQAGKHVLGLATQDSIILSTLAPDGIEYHEGFHRVFNLLTTDKTRNRLFDLYKRKYGKATEA